MPRPSAHLSLALITLLPLFLWGSYRAMVVESDSADRQVEIGVEHEQPAVMSVTHAINGSARIVDIGNLSDETLHVSVPESWRRGEVRNTPLSSVIAAAPEFGFRRWSIPSTGIVSFSTNGTMSDLTVHNPSGVPLSVRVVTIDLMRNTSDMQAYLVQKVSLRLRF